MAEITLKIHINDITQFRIGDYITLNKNTSATIIGLKAIPIETS